MRNATAVCLCVLLGGAAARAGIRVGHRPRGGPRAVMAPVKESPAQIRKRLRKEYDDSLAAAKRAFAGKNWTETRIYLKAAQAAMLEKSQAAPIKSLYEKLEKEGRKELDQAEKQYARAEYAKALKAYQLISLKFGQLPCAREARAAIMAARENPEVQSVLLEVVASVLDKQVARIISLATGASSSAGADGDKAAKKAKSEKRGTPRSGRIEQIRKLDKDKQVKVMDMLKRIAKLYPQTPTGRRAGADLQELESDEAFREALNVHRLAVKVAAALRRAETYEKAGMLDKAVMYYKQIVRDYPDTPEAEEASKRILTLQQKAGSGVPPAADKSLAGRSRRG